MEGIAGTYGVTDGRLVRKMLRRLAHRGPDASQVLEGDRWTLGARQAAVGHGHGGKPIAERDGVALACDSSLFNRTRLWETYVGPVEGPFSDQELMLEMYSQLGTAMFGQLDGGFAVAISDGGRTILARDRYGLKPLYMSGGIRKGSYSSEIKSQLLADEEFVPFPPGKYMVQRKGLSPIRPRVAPPKPAHAGGGKADRLRQSIVDGVRASMDGSDGLNLLLSGGIDSSVVACAASVVTDDIKSVCVGSEGGLDMGIARDVADRLDTDHKEVLYDTDRMLDVLDDAVYAAETFDYPLVRSCIPNFIATHSFDDRKRVTFCGEGGDEIFAGYDYMRDIRGDERLRAERMKLLRTGHATGFQRVDRMTASASLDGRMPLMARPVIDVGLSAGRRLLIGPRPEQSKLLLRESFADLLPVSVMRRRKQRFSDGAGSIHALVELSEDLVSDEEFERERRSLPKGRIRTKEELLYFRSFAKRFGRSESVLKAVGFTPRP